MQISFMFVLTLDTVCKEEIHEFASFSFKIRRLYLPVGSIFEIIFGSLFEFDSQILCRLNERRIYVRNATYLRNPCSSYLVRIIYSDTFWGTIDFFVYFLRIGEKIF